MNISKKILETRRRLDDLSAAYISKIVDLSGLEHLGKNQLRRLLDAVEFYDLSPAGFLSLNKRGEILDANLFTCTLVDEYPENILGSSFYRYVTWEDRDVLYLHLRKLFKDASSSSSCELRAEGKSGTRRYVLMSSTLVRDLVGRPVIRSVLSDITRLKKLEDELRQSHAELEIRVKERTAELEARTRELETQIARRERFEKALKGATEKMVEHLQQRKQLAGRLVEMLERDRRDTGMALHDEIGQTLAVLKMELEGIGAQLAMSPALEKIRLVEDRLAETMKLVRDMSLRLRPTPLETLGLVPSIESLIQSLGKRDGLKIHLFAKEVSGRLDPQKELALYRIAQESLTNALKYAQAAEIFVNLVQKNGSILLTVEDNGIGFDASEINRAGPSRNGSLGLAIMRERAMQFDGGFTIESEPGKGTQVIVEIPIGQKM
jgi:PAS domain S-box-containing protein